MINDFGDLVMKFSSKFFNFRCCRESENSEKEPLTLQGSQSLRDPPSSNYGDPPAKLAETRELMAETLREVCGDPP